MVGRDLEEINGRFNCHRGEINHLKIREKDSKEEVEAKTSLTLTTTYLIGSQVGRVTLKEVSTYIYASSPYNTTTQPPNT